MRFSRQVVGIVFFSHLISRFCRKVLRRLNIKRKEIKNGDNATANQTYVERIILFWSYKEQKRWWPDAIDNRVRSAFQRDKDARGSGKQLKFCQVTIPMFRANCVGRERDAHPT